MTNEMYEELKDMSTKRGGRILHFAKVELEDNGKSIIGVQCTSLDFSNEDMLKDHIKRTENVNGFIEWENPIPFDKVDEYIEENLFNK